MTGRLQVTWQDATRSLAGRNGVLVYDDLARVDLSLSYAFQPASSWVQRFPALRSARVKLSFRNLLDDKPTVRDTSGATPAGLDEDTLDPRGRTVALEVRKTFG